MEFIGIGLHVDTAIMPIVYFNHLKVMGVGASKYNLKLIGTERMKVAAARNRITNTAIISGCSHLLFLDSDHVCPEDIIDRLMKNKDCAMVSALICRRAFPFTPVVFQYDIVGNLQEAILAPGSKVVEVDACAMGCTLLNLGFVKRLEKPYWKDDHFRSDITMCNSLKNKFGGKICVDTSISVGHLGQHQVISPENADECRKDYLIKERNDAS